MDVQDDLPAVLARCAHGHTGVVARVGGPGTGQREHSAPREDLSPQTEVHMRLRTTHPHLPKLALASGTPGQPAPDLQLPPVQENQLYPLPASGQLYQSFDKVL